MSEQKHSEVVSRPLCSKGCGFYGDIVTGMCSKCSRMEMSNKQMLEMLNQKTTAISLPSNLPVEIKPLEQLLPASGTNVPYLNLSQANNTSPSRSSTASSLGNSGAFVTDKLISEAPSISKSQESTHLSFNKSLSAVSLSSSSNSTTQQQLVETDQQNKTENGVPIQVTESDATEIRPDAQTSASQSVSGPHMTTLLQTPKSISPLSQDSDTLSISSNESGLSKDGSAGSKGRCTECRKRVGLTGFQCRCGQTYCSAHRHADMHKCTFDFKQFGRQELSKVNPVVSSVKIEKL